MAVSIQELINQKDKIEQKKQETFDLDTSVGKLTVKKITKGLMAEIMAITDGSDSQGVAYILLQDQRDGKKYWGVGLSHNINLAPLRGILSAINRAKRAGHHE